MRTFIGIGLPADLRRAIALAIAPHRGRLGPVAWVAEENLHVTLKFLGEVAPGRIPEVEACLAESAGAAPPFDFSVRGMGAFPSETAPRVLWAGLREPLELVGKLQQNMEEILSGAGFPREGRAFHPHVTVGRARGVLPGKARDAFFAALADRPFGAAKASSFQLYESRLAPGGAKYSVLRDFPLRGENNGRGEDRDGTGR